MSNLNESARRMPWASLKEDGWAIVGLNHYRQDGVSHLFCSMAKQGMCITAEGTDEPAVFEDLQAQAAAAERRMQQQAQSGERIRELEAALAEVQTQG